MVNDANGPERAAQLEKAVRHSLELLERGEIEAAREELLRVAPATAPEPLAKTISDHELDAAFADAAAEVDQMLDADGVAEAAIKAADAAMPEELPEPAPLAHEVGEQFATATMAELLARQGDDAAASQIRAALEPAAVEREASNAESPEPPRPTRERVVRTLENWLKNLREGARA